jgi:hypothetical protein
MHTSRRALSLGVALTTLCFASACGDSSTEPSGTKLSAAEAKAVAGALFVQMSQVVFGSGSFNRAVLNAASYNVAAASAAPTTQPVSSQGPCDLGGSMTGTGTITENLDSKGTGPISGSGSVIPKDCKISTGAKTIAVNGDPALTWGVTMNFVEGNPSGNIGVSFGGGFKWDGGSCAINYTVTFDATGTTATIKGTVCGESVDGVFTDG